MLTFNLKKEWYDKIALGEKRIEYREVKPYLTAKITKVEVVDGKDTDLKIDKPVCALTLSAKIIVGADAMKRLFGLTCNFLRNINWKIAR